MDKLIRFSKDHKMISEMTGMYREIISNVNVINPFEYADNLNKIFQETVLPHLAFEESKVFPCIFSLGSQKLRGVVSELAKEHTQLKEKLEEINKLNSKLKSGGDAKDKDKLLSLCNELARALNEHALKEDTSIYPFLKEGDINLE